MQSIVLLCAVVLAISAIPEAFGAAKRSPWNLAKRSQWNLAKRDPDLDVEKRDPDLDAQKRDPDLDAQKRDPDLDAEKRQSADDKTCCLPNAFTAVATTQGYHRIREPTGWETTDYTKTQMVVKNGNFMYKSVTTNDDPTPSKVILQFFKTSGLQFTYYDEDKCWSQSTFYYDEGDTDTQGSFCIDDGPYDGSVSKSGVKYDVWKTDDVKGNAETVKKLYGKTNARGECVPVFEQKELIITGGQESSQNTTYVLRTSTAAESALVNKPSRLCSY